MRKTTKFYIRKVWTRLRARLREFSECQHPKRSRRAFTKSSTWRNNATTLFLFRYRGTKFLRIDLFYIPRLLSLRAPTDFAETRFANITVITVFSFWARARFELVIKDNNLFYSVYHPKNAKRGIFMLSRETITIILIYYRIAWTDIKTNK